MSDNVNNPSHYNAGGIETIEGIRAALGDGFSDYCLGNVLKYVWRCKHKGKLLEDLRKAAKYLEWAIEAAESNCPVIPDSSRAKPLAIPEGWRELEADEMPKVTDLYENEGVWRNRINDSSIEYARYEVRHIRKIETANPSETSNSSIPDPGPGYRLLSKEPPEPVIRGDEFWQNFNREWVESENFMHEGGPQAPELYYRRKIEPTEWIPKVGDKVRVNRLGRLSDGKIGVIAERDADEYTVRILGHDLTSFNLTADDLELIEAAS